MVYLPNSFANVECAYAKIRRKQIFCEKIENFLQFFFNATFWQMSLLALHSETKTVENYGLE